MPELMQRNIFIQNKKSLKDTILFYNHSGNFCYLLMSLLTNVYYYWSFFSRNLKFSQETSCFDSKLFFDIYE